MGIRAKQESSGWQRLDSAAFGIIYGSITVLSILMAAGSHPEAPLKTAAILFGSVLAITLAKAFAELMAHAIETGERITRHVWRAAWNHSHPDHPLERQEVVLTVPASFDEGARALTLQAAKLAGIPSLRLLEEPQAALYSWIQASEGAWREQVQVGDIILVVDVGGGTTDLSLIAVIETDGNLELHRIAVGDHILLGGDNMDLALAHVVAGKLAALFARTASRDLFDMPGLLAAGAFDMYSVRDRRRVWRQR
mgnify:CR=1 FL=1